MPNVFVVRRQQVPPEIRIATLWDRILVWGIFPFVLIEIVSVVAWDALVRRNRDRIRITTTSRAIVPDLHNDPI